MFSGLLVSLLWFLVFGYFGALINGKKNKDTTVGFIVGAVFGPIGLVLLLLLPSTKSEE
jgi:hypothetical protein